MYRSYSSSRASSSPSATRRAQPDPRHPRATRREVGAAGRSRHRRSAQRGRSSVHSAHRAPVRSAAARSRRPRSSASGAVASMTAKRPGSAAASARKPSRTRRWKARSNSASKRVTSPGALRAQARPRRAGRGGWSGRAGGRRSRRASSARSRSSGDARPVALVGQGRVGEPGAQDGPPGLERRSDDLGHELRRAALNSSASVVASRRRAGARAGPGEQDLAQPLAEPRPARFARHVDVEPVGSRGARRARPPGWSCRPPRVPRA